MRAGNILNAGRKPAGSYGPPTGNNPLSPIVKGNREIHAHAQETHPSPPEARTPGFFRFWAFLSLTVLVSVVVFDVRVLSAPDRVLVQSVPDDGFYYLGLARSFAHFGSWTFDSGVSTTTGFHFLNAYFLAGLYAVTGVPDETFARLAVAMCSILSLLAGLTIWTLSYRKRNAYLLAALALMASTRFWAFNSVSATEWPFVVLCATLYAAAYYKYFGDPRKNVLVLLFGLGFVGMLARSDFGVLPFSFFVAALLVSLLQKRREGVRTSLAGFAGALVGLAVLFVHSYVVSGRVLQSSVAMKMHWSLVAGPGYVGAVRSVFRALAIDGTGYLIVALLPATLALVILGFPRRNERQREGNLQFPDMRTHAREAVMMLGAAIAVLGYIFVVYPGSDVLQPWYTSNLIVPCVLLVVIDAAVIKTLLQRRRRSMSLIATFIVSLLVALDLVLFQLPGPSRPLWAHQRAMYEAGVYLREHPPDGRVGAWNAGVIGYYQGGSVINLDGLVNDAVYSFVIRNALPEYLAAQRIHYIADFQAMLSFRFFRVRGGYDRPAFVRQLQPIRSFPAGGGLWGDLVVFKVLADSGMVKP